MRLNTFLNFGGNCEQAFRFYEQHLGGEISMLMRRAEQPDQMEETFFAVRFGMLRDTFGTSWMILALKLQTT